MNPDKLISYVFPRTIEQGRTALGQKYEVNMENGVKVLNSENANYSFGSLHSIMLKGISEVLRNNKPRRILMLGLGGGSALQILKNRCRWDFHVTAVEIDKDLIQVSQEHFGLGEYLNLEIICGDASGVVKTLDADCFDLIIDDVFWDNTIPAFCLQSDYLMENKRLLKTDGVYLRNTMPESGFDYDAYETCLSACFDSHELLCDKTYGNRLYFCK